MVINRELKVLFASYCITCLILGTLWFTVGWVVVFKPMLFLFENYAVNTCIIAVLGIVAVSVRIGYFGVLKIHEKLLATDFLKEVL